MLGYAIVPLQLIIAKQAIARKGLRGHANGSVNSLRATCPISYFGGADKTNVLSKKTGENTNQLDYRRLWHFFRPENGRVSKLPNDLFSSQKKKMCNRRSVQVLEIKFE